MFMHIPANASRLQLWSDWLSSHIHAQASVRPRPVDLACARLAKAVMARVRTAVAIATDRERRCAL